jgi:hypothetical protein
MDIRIIRKSITRAEARDIAKEFYVDMVKGVVDTERGIIALGGEYHMDANTILVEDGSEQKNVWGFNFYPDKTGDEQIEYKALVNIRPLHGNTVMEIQNEDLKTAMKNIIKKLIV